MNYSIIKEALEIGLQEAERSYNTLEHNFPSCQGSINLSIEIQKIQRALKELENHFESEARYVPN